METLARLMNLSTCSLPAYSRVRRIGSSLRGGEKFRFALSSARSVDALYWGFLLFPPGTERDST